MTPDQLVILSPGRKIEDWKLNNKLEIMAQIPQPNPLVTRAIGAYQDTARRARDSLLRHLAL